MDHAFVKDQSYEKFLYAIKDDIYILVPFLYLSDVKTMPLIRSLIKTHSEFLHLNGRPCYSLDWQSVK